jgi:alpha-aminoadipate carrier protein LysW
LSGFARLLSEIKDLNNKIFGEKKMPTAVCPECDEEVYVDADSEQGDVVSCDECGSDLEVVGLDPIELDLYEGGDDYDDDLEEEERS